MDSLLAFVVPSFAGRRIAFYGRVQTPTLGYIVGRRRKLALKYNSVTVISNGVDCNVRFLNLMILKHGWMMMGSIVK